MSLRARLIIFAAAASSIGLFWFTKVPLGIPGEWTWDRIEHESGKLAVLGAVQAAVFFGVFALVAWAGSKQVGTATRKELAVWLVALMASGFAWLHAVQDTPPNGFNSAKIPFVLYYPSSSGYFHTARYEVDDTTEFLREYESIVSQGDVLHEGTHPPGLVLLFRGLIRFTEAAPDLASIPEAVMPESAEEGFDFVRSSTAGTRRALTDQDQSVIWLAGMLTQLAALAVIVPLFLLIRLSLDRETAWRTVCFWPLIPAVAMFIPKSDVLFSVVSTSLVCTWLHAVRAAAVRSSRVMSIALGALAGAIGWFGLFCSLAFLPAGAIAVLASILLFRKSQTDDKVSTGSAQNHLSWSISQHVRPAMGGVVSFAALTILVAVAWDLHLPRIWQLNYANHARFYDVSPRSYAGWLFVNPVELALAIGAPLVVKCLFRCRKLASRSPDVRLTKQIGQLIWCPKNAALVAVAAVWGLLWLTGKNSGEAARLWIPLMPLALWAGAAAWSQPAPDSATSLPARNKDQQTSLDTRDWLIILTLQAAVCLLTVLRVSGFMKERGLVD